jgi:hypothetical protein
MTQGEYNIKLIAVYLLKCAVLLFLTLGTGIIFSQESSRQFGEIDKAQLKLESDSLYPESDAAILFDYGIATISTQERHVRIKIYKKEGFKWAKMVIPDWGELGNRDILKKIKAVCYNLEGDDIISYSLDNDGIRRIKNTNDIEVSLASVKEGSIVEFQYELEIRTHEWYFQYTIPVYRSEFLIVNPNNYIYQIINKGSVPFFIYDKDYNGYTRYVAKNVPPFTLEEPVTTIKNHIAKVEYHLSKYIPITNDTMNYAPTWYEVYMDLLSSEKFGECLDGGLFLNDLKENILAKDSLDINIMVSAHEKIKELITWNQENLVFTDFTLRSAFKAGSGNSADINLTLVLLLRKLGFDADPVVMATRDRGHLTYAQPKISNLNYVLVAVTVNHKLYLMDATNPYLIVDMLPLQALNDKGMIIDDKQSYWIEFDNQLPYKSFQMNTFELDSLGNIKGIVQSSKEWYAAYEFRNNYANLIEQSISYETFLEKEKPGMMVISYNLTNFDNLYKPLQEVYEVEIKNKTGITDEIITLNPMFYNRLTDNPFKLENRSYPVEYPYLQDKFYMLNLKVPEGFQITEIPEDILVTLPGNTAKFEYRTNVLGNQIQITNHIQINKLIFQPEEYKDLKAFFYLIVSKHAELIELIKIDKGK